MNCKEFENDISLYIDGKLSIKEQVAFKDHLNQCSSCQVKLENTEKMIVGLKEQQEVKAPKDLSKSIIEQIKMEEALNAVKTESQDEDSIDEKSFARSLPVKKFALAAALVLVVASTVILNSNFFRGSMDEGAMTMESLDQVSNEESMVEDREGSQDFSNNEESAEAFDSHKSGDSDEASRGEITASDTEEDSISDEEADREAESMEEPGTLEPDNAMDGEAEDVEKSEVLEPKGSETLEQYEKDILGIKYGEWIVLLLGIGVISVIVVLRKSRNT